MNKISHIIIAYNEAKNIQSCINSITAQRGIRAYEIVIVNDASTDTTELIVNTIALSDKHVKTVHFKTNKGRGAARAAGVARATGDTVAFVDADIMLPPHWTATCLRYLKHSDAVGGIARPDGEVTYLYRTFGLKPKITRHTAELTGNNFMIRKDVLARIPINPHLRNGEDVDFVWRAKKAGYSVTSIGNLVVRHTENKSYITSVGWLYQSGIGAGNLLFRHKKLRLPDILFYAYLFLILLSLTKCLYVIALYPFVVSVFHVRSKFFFTYADIPKILGAVCVDYSFMHAYFMGRFIGLFVNI